MRTRLLACCLLLTIASLAASAAEGDLPPLTNPGFEDLARGWSEDLLTRFASLAQVSTEVTRTGTHALRLTSERGTENPFLARPLPELQPAATYAARVWVRAQAGHNPGLAAIRLEFRNAAGEVTSSHTQRILPAASADPKATPQWAPLEVVAQADPDTQSGTLSLRLMGAGTIWFDDVELTRAAPPPAVTLAPLRQNLTAARTTTVSLIATLSRAWEGAEPPAVTVTIRPALRGSTLHPTPAVSLVSPHQLSLSFELPGLEPGSYSVQCALKAGQEPAAAWLHVPLPERRPSALREDGVLLVNRQPFFPIGLYHVSTADYPQIARAGFNCVQGPAAADARDLTRAMDTARAANLMVELPLHSGGKVLSNLTSSQARLGRIRKHPALLGAKLLDEPDLHPRVCDEVPVAYQTLKAADPDHPFTLTLTGAERVPVWAPYCDILQITAYLDAGEPASPIADQVRQAAAALQPWQNLAAVLQAGWVADPMNQPTFAQARLAVYLSIINGARGIFWYALRDPGWDLTRTPLWGRFEELNRETATLGQWVTTGKPAPDLKLEAPEGLGVLARIQGDRTAVLLANPTDQPLTLSVPLPPTECRVSCLGGLTVTRQDAAATVTIPPEGADLLTIEPPGQPGAVAPPTQAPPAQPGEPDQRPAGPPPIAPPS